MTPEERAEDVACFFPEDGVGISAKYKGVLKEMIISKIQSAQRETVRKTMQKVRESIESAFSDESPTANMATKWLRIGILDVLSGITPEKVLGE